MGCLTAVRIPTVDGCDVQATTLGMAVSMAKRRGSSGCASSATRRTACVAAIEVCGISRKSWEMDVETDVEMGLAEDEGEEDNAFSSNGQVVDVKMSVRGKTVRQEVQGKRCKSICAKVHVGSMAMRIPTWTAKTGRIVLQTRKVKCWPKQVQVVAVDESVGSTPDVIPRLGQGLDDLLVCFKVIYLIRGLVFVECSFDPISSCLFITYCLTDATDWNQTKPVCDSAQGWIFLSGRSDSKHTQRV